MQITKNLIISGLVIFLGLLLACSDPRAENKQIQRNANRITSISLKGNKYQIDTTIILTNQNLQGLIDDLDKAPLITHNRVKDIPDFIVAFLDSLTGEDFSIANPGEDWQVGDVVFEKLPVRQLVYLRSDNDIALFSYFTGGFGKSEHILVFKFKDKRIIDFWCGNVGPDLYSKTEIIDYIKNNKDKSWGLNTNVIYL